MGLENLYTLKEQYERELIRAEAKVTVVTDLIALEEAKIVAHEEVADEIAVDTIDTEPTMNY
jgi:hypothetical protein